MTASTQTGQSTETPRAPRRVFLLNESCQTADGYVPSIVEENTAGHFPCTFTWGADYATARRIADDANRQLGHSPNDVLDVIASSMRASNRWCPTHESYGGRCCTS